MCCVAGYKLRSGNLPCPISILQEVATEIDDQSGIGMDAKSMLNSLNKSYISTLKSIHVLLLNKYFLTYFVDLERFLRDVSSTNKIQKQGSQNHTRQGVSTHPKAHTPKHDYDANTKTVHHHASHSLHNTPNMHETFLLPDCLEMKSNNNHGNSHHHSHQHGNSIPHPTSRPQTNDHTIIGLSEFTNFDTGFIPEHKVI